MADEDRSFEPTQAETNRSREQGGGMGARELQRQGDPAAGATTERTVAGINDGDGDLGAGTPANVDVHKLGQRDKPEEDWGDPADEGAQFSSNHNDRGLHRGDDVGQGSKTRQHNRDTMSRRV